MIDTLMTSVVIFLLGLVMLFAGSPRKGGWQRVIGAMLTGLGAIGVVVIVVFAGQLISG